MKINKKYMSLMLASALSVSAAVSTSAWDLKLDKLAEVVGDYIADTLSEEEQFQLLEDAITKLLNSNFFKEGNTRDKIELLKTTLIDTGLVDADTVESMEDSIMEFEFQGIKIGVLIDYLDYAFYDEKYQDDTYGSEDYIESGKMTDKTAQIMYGLGFDNIEKQLNYSADKWSEHGLNTEINNSCTVSDFKSQLAGKDLVVIEEHGNFDYANTPMIIVDEEVTLENYDGIYADDIANGRVEAIGTIDGFVYWLKPEFFSYYYGPHSLDDTIIWIGSCEGNKNNDLVNVFTEAGAQVVMGHSESVYTQYDYCILNNTVDELINGKSMAEAVEIAKGNWGYDDVEFYNHSPHLFNNTKATSYPCLTGNTSW